jgi:Rrf2 family transcriptional regulator, repressor of oqxAB
MGSGRFAMAVHALAVLAQTDEGYPSAYIAGSVNTHAVFLRRILRELVGAGLVEAREGRTGGYRLARPAEQITLADVYRAIEPAGPIAPSPAEPNARCPIGAGMRGAFAEVAAAAEDGLVAALSGRTVADLSRRALRGRRNDHAPGAATRASGGRPTASRMR